MNLNLSFHRAVDATLTLLYPTACRVCGESVESWQDGVVCAKCWEQFGTVENLCGKCGVPLQPLPAHINLDPYRCGRCDDFAFDYARSCGAYQGPLRECVLWLKMYPHLAPRLRKMLYAAFVRLNEIEPVESILPVPLHPSRLAERTFNQAEIIARALGAETGLRVDRVSLVRVKQTERHRAGMGARLRARSLEKAFRVRASRLVENRALLVVDDVMTTGSTADEIARTLLASGAKSVNFLTLARAKNEFTL